MNSHSKRIFLFLSANVFVTLRGYLSWPIPNRIYLQNTVAECQKIFVESPHSIEHSYGKLNSVYIYVQISPEMQVKWKPIGR